MDILTQYGHPPKNHMQPLTDQELSIVFEYLTQHNQVDSIESIYADVYHEPAAAKSAAPAAKQPAQGQQQARAPTASRPSSPLRTRAPPSPPLRAPLRVPSSKVRPRRPPPISPPPAPPPRRWWTPGAVRR